jgi:hypothetical protein
MRREKYVRWENKRNKNLHCQSEIPKKAKVCPNCRKKQGGIMKFVLIAVVVIVIIILFASGSGGTNVSDESKGMSESDFKAACTTIDYEELFRNNEQYSGEKVKFTGEIQQVIYDGESYSQYLISVTKDEYDYYSDNVYVVLDRTNAETKFLEDDIVTFYGEANETYSYTSILGETIEVPEVDALYMDLEK